MKKKPKTEFQKHKSIMAKLDNKLNGNGRKGSGHNSN